MRFCPFCTAENVVDATTCAACGRRLPPPPTRKRAPGAPPTGMFPTAGAAPLAAAPSPSTAVTVPVIDDERRALRTSLLPPPTAVRRKAPTIEPRAGGVEARRKDDVADATRTTVQATPADFGTGAGAGDGEGTRPIDASWFIDANAGEDLDAPAPPPRAGGDGRGASDPAIGDDTSAQTFVAPDPTRTVVAPPPVVPARLAPLAPAEPTTPRRKATTLPPPTPPPPAPAVAAPAPPVVPRPPTPLPPKLPPVPHATPSSVRAQGKDATALNPPPTRIVRDEAMVDRPFTPPTVIPVPGVPEPGLLNVARYAVTFGRARWQRRRAVKLLQVEIKSDTDALDGVLLTLGRDARTAGVDNRVLAAENAAISDAEKRQAQAAQQGVEIGNRKLEETAKYEELERERTIKITDAERTLEDAQRELTTLEAQRRGLRDKRKELERRQKAYLQAAEQRDTEAGTAPMGDARGELRRAADGHRREAASLDPERQDLERRLTALDRPLGYAQSKVETAKAELDQQRRALADAREGYRHRLAELDAEAARKARDHDLISGEINRRLVNLGTLINLHRVERPEFGELYGRIDRLRNAINARTTEIDRLTAERDAYDRGSLLRGYAVLAGVAVLVITFVVIILALV